MKPLVPIIFFFICLITNAQETEVFTVGTKSNINAIWKWTHHPIYFDNSLSGAAALYQLRQRRSVEKRNINSFNFTFQYPIKVKKSNTLTPKLFYEFQDRNVNLPIDLETYKASNNFHQIILGLHWNKQYTNNKWETELSSNINLNTSFIDFNFRQLVVESDALINYLPNDQLKLKVGLRHNSFREFGFFPLIGFDLNWNEEYSLNFLSFDNISFTYKLNRKIDFTLEALTIIEYWYSGKNSFSSRLNYLPSAFGGYVNQASTEDYYEFSYLFTDIKRKFLLPQRVNLNMSYNFNKKYKLFFKSGVISQQNLTSFYNSKYRDIKVKASMIFELGFTMMK